MISEQALSFWLPRIGCLLVLILAACGWVRVMVMAYEWWTVRRILRGGK